MKFSLTVLLFASLAFAQDNSAHNGMMQIGKKIYEKTCISCHGVDGETASQMELVVKPRQLNKSILSEKQMFYIVKFGAHTYGAHADIMPTFKYVYDDTQIASVVHYVSQKFNKNRDQRVAQLLSDSRELSLKEKEDMLQVGKKIFHKKCGMCHGDRGNGESQYVEQSKADENFIYPYNLQKILLSEDQIFLFAKYGGHFWGTAKNDMPSWKRKYDDVKLKSTAHYIYQKIKKPL
jgi:mono/diheme cytochrome c family protein